MKEISVDLDNLSTPHKNETDRSRKLRDANETGKSKKPKRRKVILIIAAILLISTLIFAGLRWKRLRDAITGFGEGGSIVSTCTNILDPVCWTEAFRPQLKQHEGFTNMLIVGLDTRDSGRGAALQNTDTIIVARLNHETGQTMMISIPRDFYVSFKIGDKGPFSMKITSVSATGENRDDVENGMDLLQQVAEEIIGQPIQYRTVIKLGAVEEAVNTFDGVDIEIDEAFAAKYPNDEPSAENPAQWLRYEFEEGLNHLDGERALVYARFRKVYSGDSSLASDFSRGRRQQEVISALKEKALSEDLNVKQKAEKYWEILQNLSKNVETDATFEDILAAISLIEKINSDSISIVLDPNFGGIGKLIYHPPTDETIGYIIRPRDLTYGDIQDEIVKIWEYGNLYNEQAHLVVSNRTGLSYPTDHLALELKNDDAPLGAVTYLTHTKTETTGVRIYDFSEGKYPETIKFLKEFFETDNSFDDPETYEIEQTNYGEDIMIVVGPEEASE
ncbi:MAG TPA: LytR family transcriptional regulator [bacterium]|nr:LytR family transcriptional regulator [bacterium]